MLVGILNARKYTNTINYLYSFFLGNTSNVYIPPRKISSLSHRQETPITQDPISRTRIHWILHSSTPHATLSASNQHQCSKLSPLSDWASCACPPLQLALLSLWTWSVQPGLLSRHSPQNSLSLIWCKCRIPNILIFGDSTGFVKE